MQHGLTRNRTYELLALGQYSNIRTFKQGTHRKLPDSSLEEPSGDLWVLPPPAPPACLQPDGTPTCYQGWQTPNASTVDEFSAACWFTAQELLTSLDQDKSPPILGTDIRAQCKMDDALGCCSNAKKGDLVLLLQGMVQSAGAPRLLAGLKTALGLVETHRVQVHRRPAAEAAQILALCVEWDGCTLYQFDDFWCAVVPGAFHDPAPHQQS